MPGCSVSFCCVTRNCSDVRLAMAFGSFVYACILVFQAFGQEPAVLNADESHLQCLTEPDLSPSRGIGSRKAR